MSCAPMPARSYATVRVDPAISDGTAPHVSMVDPSPLSNTTAGTPGLAVPATRTFNWWPSTSANVFGGAACADRRTTRRGRHFAAPRFHAFLVALFGAVAGPGTGVVGLAEAVLSVDAFAAVDGALTDVSVEGAFLSVVAAGGLLEVAVFSPEHPAKRKAAIRGRTRTSFFMAGSAMIANRRRLAHGSRIASRAPPQ